MANPSARYYYKGSRLKQLRAFCHVARLGSVTRAAEALFLSQPAGSLQLGALETELGAQLFERQGRRINLTHEGQALYEIARPLVDGFDAIEGEFHNRLRGLSTCCRRWCRPSARRTRKSSSSCTTSPARTGWR